MNISHDDNVNLDFVRDVILAWSFSIYLLQDDLSRICNTKRITAKVFFFFLFLQSPREIIEGIKEKFSQKIFPISEKYWQYRVREENVHLKHHWKINFKLKARGCICQIQLDLSVSIRVTDTLRIFRKDRITRRNNSNRIKKKKNEFIYSRKKL